MASSRRDVTTEHLRNVAAELLLDHGVQAFSLNAVSHAAYVSIGAVYERWESKSEALADVHEVVVRSALQEQVARLHDVTFRDQQWILFADADALRAQQLLVEMLFAARDDRELLRAVTETVTTFRAELQRPLGESELAAALANWNLCTLLGNALLRVGRASVCDLGEEVAHGLELATRYEHGGYFRPIDSGVTGLMPMTLPPPTLDATGERIREATRSVLSDAHEASTREVAAQAGVTTGALYRRFGSKSELINDVLITELQSDRYAWSAELVSTWKTAANTDALADVISRQFVASLANTPQVSMLLQITAQARSDETVRTMVVSQIENVVRTREQLFAAIKQLGVMAPFTTSLGQAWLFQATPIGARLLKANDCGPTPEQITLAIRAIAASFLAHDEN